MGFLQPEQITVHDAQQVCAIEALGRLEQRGIDRRELVALIVQPRDLALQTMGAHIRKLPVVLMFAGLRGKERLGCKVALHESSAICCHCRLACEGGRVAGVFDCGDWLQPEIAAASKTTDQAAPTSLIQGHCDSPIF